MLSLRGSCRRGASTQLLARRFTGPGTGIDVTNHTEPLFGFRLCGEVAHVQTEALAAFLEAAADEERETLELGQINLRQGHWRGGRAQVQDERARVGFRRRRLSSNRRARGHIGRW
jgi:hypothetical protein